MKYITLTPKVAEFLNERRIFLTPDGRPRGEKWGVPDDLILEPYASIFGGSEFTSMGSFSYCTGGAPRGTTIGRYCSIGSSVGILGFNHPTTWVSTSNLSYETNGIAFKSYAEDNRSYEFPALDVTGFQRGGVSVGNDVWIGWNVSLSQGITVGDGAVVAANSNVVRDVEPYAIVGGNPARVLKKRFSDEIISRFESIKWWRYAPRQLPTEYLNNPEKFLDLLDEIGEQVPSWPEPTYGEEILSVASRS